MLCLLPLAGCGESGLALDDIRERGFLRAGYADEPPYAFVDSGGSVVGESPEILSAAATAAGIPEIRWVQLELRELLPALRQGRVDVVAAGLYVTPAREAQVRFSRPTSCSGPALLVSGVQDSVRAPTDLAGERARIAVLTGSVEEAAMPALGISEEGLVRVPDLRTGVAAVQEGQVDALAVTEPTARWAADGAERGLAVVPYASPPDLEHLLRGCSALAFRRSDEELVAAIDVALAGPLTSPERRVSLRAQGFTPPRSGAAAGGSGR